MCIRKAKFSHLWNNGKIYIFIFLIPILSGCSDEITLTVSNPTQFILVEEPVVIDVSRITEIHPDFVPSECSVLNAEGDEILSQFDDIDFDGNIDEIVFRSDFAALEKKSFKLSKRRSEQENYISKTNAAIWKLSGDHFESIKVDTVENEHDPRIYRYDGVGWESELIGYRLYLDERNAIDVFGKRVKDLMLDVIGTTDSNYHEDAAWGMDILKVGSALGVGGISIWANDSLYRPVDLQSKVCRIISSGPIRSIVRIDYEGWPIGETSIDITSVLSIYSGERITEHKVLLNNNYTPITLGTGIVKHEKANVVFNEQVGSLHTIGIQSLTEDSLLLAVVAARENIIGRTEYLFDHLLLLKFEEDNTLKFLFASAWHSEEFGTLTDSSISDLLRKCQRRLKGSLVIEIK